MTGGGFYGNIYLSSTEIYVQSTWSYAASLPSPRRYLSASTVDNSVFVFGKIFKFSSQTETVTFCNKGGHDGDEIDTDPGYDEILGYDPVRDTWSAAGRMKSPRIQHSSFMMSLGDISGLCDSVDGNWSTWRKWGVCSEQICGSGIQTWIRECDDPAPRNGGADCPGDDVRIERCVIEHCPVELYGGNNKTSGNVYVINRNGYFGPVCDNGWTNTSATVVCRLRLTF